jgi:hypothetical protein
MVHQRVGMASEIRMEERLHGRADAVNDCMQISRLRFRSTPELFQRRKNGPAPGMPEYYDESCTRSFCGEFDAGNLRRGDDVASNADDKQVTKALIEDDLRRNSRIGTSKDNGEGLLAFGQRLTPRRVR